jgi:hypothetical protein
MLQPGDLLVIEGHASEDGSHESNYALSVRRAQSIYEELVNQGVPPGQLSWRGMGETAPVVPGSTEAELQENRRVSFYVVRLEGEQAPQTPEVVLPWNGKAVPTRTPVAEPKDPATPPEPQGTPEPTPPATPTTPPEGQK